MRLGDVEGRIKVRVRCSASGAYPNSSCDAVLIGVSVFMGPKASTFSTIRTPLVDHFKYLVTLAACALFAMVAHADDVTDFTAINAAARAARERGDTAGYLENVRKLVAFTPGHPRLQVALARGTAGDRAGAIAQLNKIADLGFSFDAANDTAFAGLKDDPGFTAAAKRLAENGKGTGRSKGIIKLGLPAGSEGVAWSEASKALLMGSSGSIYAYKLDGGGAAKPVGCS